MKKVSTDSYKGVRDFYPADMSIHNYILDTWKKVLVGFGYEEYSASILESSELYESKTNEEIVSEQTYNFTDRGDRKITLRPEMTPTVARMIAKKRREMSLPIKWFSIPNVFRYEQPQKGRLREHWQLNVDMFGSENISAEIEIIQIANSVMNAFGLHSEDFIIKINDLEIVNRIFEDLKLDEESARKFRRLLDKKNKIENFPEEAERIIGRPFDVTPNMSHKLAELVAKLHEIGIENIVFDPMLVRGFDYYTGIVFEIYDTNPENRRALFGGGRYDNLLEIFEEEKMPAVGFGMGDVTIKDALETRGLLPENQEIADLYVAVLDEKYYSFALKLSNEIRKDSVSVYVDNTFKKISGQIEKADKKKNPFFICIGENEVKKNKFKIKNMKTGKEKTISGEKIAHFIHKNI